MLEKADEYIKKYDQGKSPEELFIEFEQITRMHAEFREHLKTLDLNLDNMRRSEKMMLKRKIFMEWYLQKNQDRYMEDVIDEISEMTFLTGRTVYIAVKNN